MPPAIPASLSRALGAGFLLWLPAALAAQAQTPDWRSDWGVADGFSLHRDTDGYLFPTSIALVPHPGREPGDPLYFVTELQGTIKVVTNDRSVHVFARVPAPVKATLPDAEAEVGLAGICLEPGHGFVFATYTYHDTGGVLRNADAQAVSVAELLLTPPPPDTAHQRPNLLKRLSPRRRLQLVLVLGMTFAAGAAAGVAGTWLVRRKRSPGSPAATAT